MVAAVTSKGLVMMLSKRLVHWPPIMPHSLTAIRAHQAATCLLRCEFVSLLLQIPTSFFPLICIQSSTVTDTCLRMIP